MLGFTRGLLTKITKKKGGSIENKKQPPTNPAYTESFGTQLNNLLREISNYKFKENIQEDLDSPQSIDIKELHDKYVHYWDSKFANIMMNQDNRTQEEDNILTAIKEKINDVKELINTTVATKNYLLDQKNNTSGLNSDLDSLENTEEPTDTKQVNLAQPELHLNLDYWEKDEITKKIASILKSLSQIDIEKEVQDKKLNHKQACRKLAQDKFTAGIYEVRAIFRDNPHYTKNHLYNVFKNEIVKRFNALRQGVLPLNFSEMSLNNKDIISHYYVTPTPQPKPQLHNKHRAESTLNPEINQVIKQSQESQEAKEQEQQDQDNTYIEDVVSRTLNNLRSNDICKEIKDYQYKFKLDEAEACQKFAKEFLQEGIETLQEIFKDKESVNELIYKHLQDYELYVAIYESLKKGVLPVELINKTINSKKESLNLDTISTNPFLDPNPVALMPTPSESISPNTFLVFNQGASTSNTGFRNRVSENSIQ